MQKEEKQFKVDIDFSTRLPEEGDNSIPIIGHLSNINHASLQPLTIKTVEGKITTISQMPIAEANMGLLTSLDNLPDSLQEFIGKLKSNTVAIFNKKGSVYIEISLTILRSVDVFQSFLGYYHQLLAEFPALTNYCELCEATEKYTVKKAITPKGDQTHLLKECFVTRHFYIIVHVEELILDKLEVTLAAKSENLDIAKSMSYLSKEGVSDKELQKMFQLDERAFYRWKAKAKVVTDRVSVAENNVAENNIP